MPQWDDTETNSDPDAEARRQAMLDQMSVAGPETPQDKSNVALPDADWKTALDADAARSAASAAPNNHARVDAALQSAGSTDDASYWYGKIDNDPNGYGSAWDYWTGRINQGDGAAAVRAGTQQKFNDGGGSVYEDTAQPSYTQGQTYTQAQIPGLVQLDPGLFGDNQGHFFDASGTYRGGDTTWFYGTPQTTTSVGGPGPDPREGSSNPPTTTTTPLVDTGGPTTTDTGGPTRGTDTIYDYVPPQGPSTVTTGASTPDRPSTQTPTFNARIRQQLLDLLGQGPVSENDPDIAPAIAANRTSRERSLQQERDQIAERMNAQNLTGSGAMDTAMRQAMEGAGSDEASFSGNLVATQALARRTQIQQLLSAGVGLLSNDQQQQLQRELAAIDATLRAQTITNQNQQFYSGQNAANQRYYYGENQQNQQYYYGQGQQDQQYNDNQGRLIGEFQAEQNRKALLDAMGVHV